VLRAAATQAAARGKVILDRAEVAIEVPESSLEGRDERLVAQKTLVHRLRTGIERIHLSEGRACSLGRALDRRPRARIRRRVRGAKVRRARGKQRVLVREVAVHRRAADPCALGDRADRSLRGAELLVESDGALGDSSPRLLLELGAPL